jgi:nicotinic acid mononucleotide adenylyltransferase
VDFIVVSRPGFSGRAIWKTVPRDLVRSRPGNVLPERIELRSTNLYVLQGVDVPVASRGIRQAIRAGRRVTGLVPQLVEQYILKEGLYRPARTGFTR